jgi:hypothetical protein
MGMGRLEHNGTAIRVQSKYRTEASFFHLYEGVLLWLLNVLSIVHR